MKKINLLLIRRNLLLGSTGGGSGKVLRAFQKYFDKGIFNISFCSFEKGDLEQALKKSGFKIHVLPNQDPERFSEFIRDQKIDVVYFVPWGEKPELTKAAKRGGASAILLMDNAGKMLDRGASSLLDRQLASKMCAVRYRRWHGMRREEFHKNHMVVYCPIDFDFIEKHSLTHDEISRRKKRLGIASEDVVIGRIGRADTGKWDDVLIDMMPHLLKKTSNVKFMIMGIPEAKKDKIRKMGLEKYFILIDPDPSDAAVAELLSLIDIFAYASVQGETFGMSIAEAMATKKPIVVKSTPMVDNAQIELVDNGKTGFVAYSPEAFADAVACLATRPELAKNMGLAGYEKARQEFEARKTVRMVERRILEILAEKGKIPKKMLASYKDARKFPTPKEIDDFEEEYERRLKDIIGKPDSIRIFIGKHVSFSPVMQRFIRSVKLTNLRNSLRKAISK